MRKLGMSVYNPANVFASRNHLLYTGKACAKPPVLEILEWRNGGYAKFCARNFECDVKSTGLLQHHARTGLEIHGIQGLRARANG
jgi:hypothetical protein